MSPNVVLLQMDHRSRPATFVYSPDNRFVTISHTWISDGPDAYYDIETRSLHAPTITPQGNIFHVMLDKARSKLLHELCQQGHLIPDLWCLVAEYTPLVDDAFMNDVQEKKNLVGCLRWRPLHRNDTTLPVLGRDEWIRFCSFYV